VHHILNYKTSQSHNQWNESAEFDVFSLAYNTSFLQPVTAEDEDAIERFIEEDTVEGATSEQLTHLGKLLM